MIPPTAREPAWVDVVRSVLQNSTQLAELKSQLPGGLLVVRREKDTFVVSFGHGWQKLEDQWLESDFGLRVALNSIPPDKIIEIRAESVRELAYRKREGSSGLFRGSIRRGVRQGFGRKPGRHTFKQPSLW